VGQEGTGDAADAWSTLRPSAPEKLRKPGTAQPDRAEATGERADARDGPVPQAAMAKPPQEANDRARPTAEIRDAALDARCFKQEEVRRHAVLARAQGSAGVSRVQQAAPGPGHCRVSSVVGARTGSWSASQSGSWSESASSDATLPAVVDSAALEIELTGRRMPVR
jgi:hypothetical protein